MSALLAKRVPLADVELGRAYVIHARNGGVGVAVREGERIGYRLHREKFSRHYLFVEWDWDEGEPHGTAIPLRLLEDRPPEDGGALLSWLAERERELRDEIASNHASTRVQR
ncbi:MAG: hypothetical protein MUE69_24490 [Myxococcota bacterium]|jgi:hypothetical protein|nr:hypothetical protein [Myxococcota bacterium]